MVDNVCINNFHLDHILLLRPDVLNLDTIFDKALLALNDSYSIAERSKNGELLYECHPSFWEKLGFEKPYPVDKWMSQIDDRSQTTFQAKLNTFFLSEDPAFVTHVPILNAKGETLWFIVQTVRLGEKNSLKQSFLFMLKDVSMKRRENQLLKEGQRIVGMGFWEWDIVKNKLHWSEVTKEIHEVEKDYRPTLETGINFYKEGDSRNRISEAIQRTLETGQSYSIELIIVTAKGNEVWVESRAKADIENEKVVRIYGTFQNITDRKRIENKLRVNEESFRGSFENAAIGMAVVGPEGEWVKVNKSLTEIVGYSMEELQRFTFQDITHSEDLDIDLTLLQELISGERESYQIEKRFIHKKGHEIWIVLSVSMVRDENRNPLYFVSQISDINERKKAQQQLIEAHTEIQGIIDASTHVSIIATDTKGVIQQFNKGAENLLGYKAEEMIGKETLVKFHKKEEVIERCKQLSEMFHKKIEGFETFIFLSKTRKFESREWTYIRKDGLEFPVQLVVTARKGRRGEIVGYLGMATDIRDRKKTEELQKQMAILQSKSEEMEQFAYITSHDLREPLLTITNYINLLNTEFKSSLDSNVVQFFGYISGAADRLNCLINGLLQYSRLSNTPEKTVVDLNAVMKDVLVSLRASIDEKKADIFVDALPSIDGYREHLFVLLQNLIQNALKFVDEGTVPKIIISGQKREKDVRIEVIDNGIGIEEKYYQKIFTIFQRLHDHNAYEGNGMGLSLAKKIVELHNGLIIVENNENGQGSKFIITLPFQ